MIKVAVLLYFKLASVFVAAPLYDLSFLYVDFVLETGSGFEGNTRNKLSTPVSGVVDSNEYDFWKDNVADGADVAPKRFFHFVSEECHDPLCKRIARANKRPDQPIPVSSYFVVLIILACAGLGVYLVARVIAEPEE